jgi:hypothetical protein
MKFIKIVTVALAVASFAFTAPAQGGRSLDLYGASRTVILAAPQNIGPSASFVTNGPIDIRMFDGVSTITFFCETNTGTAAGTLTASVYTTSNVYATNLTALTYALSANSTFVYTNIANTNWTASSTYILPGSVTTPTAATAGWQTPYFTPAQFTNTAAVTVSGANFYQIGTSVGDAGRYLYIIWTPGGSATNFTAGAILTGATHAGQLY